MSEKRERDDSPSDNERKRSRRSLSSSSSSSPGNSPPRAQRSGPRLKTSPPGKSSPRQVQPPPRQGPPPPPPMPPGVVRPFTPVTGNMSDQLWEAHMERGLYDEESDRYISEIKFPATQTVFGADTVSGFEYLEQKAPTITKQIDLERSYSPVYEGPIRVTGKDSVVHVRPRYFPHMVKELPVESDDFMHWPHVIPGQVIPGKYKEWANSRKKGVDRTIPLRQFKMPPDPELSEREKIITGASKFQKRKKFADFNKRRTPIRGTTHLPPVHVPQSIPENDSLDSVARNWDRLKSKGRMRIESVSYPINPGVKQNSKVKQGIPFYTPIRKGLPGLPESPRRPESPTSPPLKDQGELSRARKNED